MQPRIVEALRRREGRKEGIKKGLERFGDERERATRFSSPDGGGDDIRMRWFVARCRGICMG